MPNLSLSRRGLLAALASVAVPLPAALAEALPRIKVSRDPGCGCCEGWAEHLRQAGFPADLVDTAELNRLKAGLGVPQALMACHTAEVAGYVIEGHVPAAAIRRLLAEKPQARGLAVPGMPAGSPGMEVEGVAPEAYDVVLFGPSGQRTFARYRGTEEI